MHSGRAKLNIDRLGSSSWQYRVRQLALCTRSARARRGGHDTPRIGNLRLNREYRSCSSICIQWLIGIPNIVTIIIGARASGTIFKYSISTLFVVPPFFFVNATYECVWDGIWPFRLAGLGLPGFAWKRSIFTSQPLKVHFTWEKSMDFFIVFVSSIRWWSLELFQIVKRLLRLIFNGTSEKYFSELHHQRQRHAFIASSATCFGVYPFMNLSTPLRPFDFNFLSFLFGFPCFYSLEPLAFRFPRSLSLQQLFTLS